MPPRPASPNPTGPGLELRPGAQLAPATLPPHPSAGSAQGLLGGLLLLVLVLQLWTWSRLSGYQLADSIEYLERAETVFRGQPLDPGTLRSFAFSALLLPLFWLQSWLPVDWPALPVFGARCLQVALGLAAAYRLGRWVAESRGTASGLVAAAVLTLNPIFLRWSVEPLSATAALFAVTAALIALDRFYQRNQRPLAHGLTVGLWLGVSVWMAYQNVLVAGAVLVWLPLLKRFRRLAFWFGLLLALSSSVLLQCLLDQWTYGRFGSSFLTYFAANFLPQVGTLLYKAGFVDLAKQLYALGTAAMTEGAEIRTKTSRLWYLHELLPQGLPLLAVSAIACGALISLFKRQWFLLVLMLAVLLNVVMMSTKGSKSFRLWMPLLPLLALLAAPLGALLGEQLRKRSRVLSAVALALLMLTLGGHALHQLSSANLQKFGSYWRAIAAVEVGTPSEPRRIASAYNWAVRYQNPAGTQVIKLPHHMDRWPDLDGDQRAEVIASLESMDAFVGHLQSFAQDPLLMEAINRRFAVRGVYHDFAHAEELAPVYHLERRSGAPDEHTFFDVYSDTGPGEPHEPGRVQAGLQYPGSVDFRRPEGEAVYQMVLLGFEVDPGWVDGSQAWVTYTWYAGPLGGKDYHIIDRYTDGRGGAWQNNHRPAYGAWPTNRWVQGSIIQESYLTQIPPDPVPFGGPYRRGDRLPVRLWMAIAEFNAEMVPVGGLNPFRPSGRMRSSRLPWKPGKIHDGGSISEEGRVWSAEGLSQVGGFFLPIPPAWRVADDGQTIPEPPG